MWGYHASIIGFLFLPFYLYVSIVQTFLSYYFGLQRGKFGLFKYCHCIAIFWITLLLGECHKIVQKLSFLSTGLTWYCKNDFSTLKQIELRLLPPCFWIYFFGVLPNDLEDVIFLFFKFSAAKKTKLNIPLSKSNTNFQCSNQAEIVTNSADSLRQTQFWRKTQ